MRARWNSWPTTAARSGVEPVAGGLHLGTSRGGKVAGFAKLIEEIKQATRDLPLAEAIDHVIEASGLADYYRADKDGADRLENLNELVNAAALFLPDPDAFRPRLSRGDGSNH